MPRQWEVHRKAENSRAVYWGCGPTITVLEQPGYSDRRRLWCMTDHTFDCEHVRAVRRALGLDGTSECAV